MNLRPRFFRGHSRKTNRAHETWKNLSAATRPKPLRFLNVPTTHKYWSFPWSLLVFQPILYSLSIGVLNISHAFKWVPAEMGCPSAAWTTNVFMGMIWLGGARCICSNACVAVSAFRSCTQIMDRVNQVFLLLLRACCCFVFIAHSGVEDIWHAWHPCKNWHE